MKRSSLIKGVVILLLFTPSLCGHAMKESKEDKTSEEEGSAMPDYIFRDVVHFHYEEGALKAKVIFEDGEYYSERGELCVEKCRFVYYDINRDVISRGSSRRATLFADDSKLIAEEEVVVISEENKGKLETEYLEWHGDENIFTTDRFVKITQENGDTISGVGMIADTGLKRVTIKKDVRGSFQEESVEGSI